MVHVIPLLAQEQMPVEAPPELPFWVVWRMWLSGPVWLLYIGMLIWMIVYCARNDPERWLWIWVMLLLPYVGVLIYFVVRYLPSADWGETNLMRHFRRRAAVSRLESAARQIGNPYQHVQLADALRETGQPSRALESYQRALDREPDNLAALWGAANIEYSTGDYAAARENLSRVLDQDFAYKFGDVSLLYAKTLIALKDSEAARQHLEQHVRKWRQPEAMYLLAKLCVDDNDSAAARGYLQELLLDMQSSPKSIARKHLFWRSRAKRLLRRIS